MKKDKLKRFNFDGNKKTTLKNAALALPLALIALLSAAFIAGVVILFIYSVVISVAFTSSMASLMLFGATAVALAAGLAITLCFKKYLSFYRNKLGIITKGHRYKQSEDTEDNQEIVKSSENKSSADDKKAKFKKFLTVSNAACATALVGILLVVISAGTGGLNRDNWIEASSGYMHSNGYYNETNVLDVAVPPGYSEIDENAVVKKISINLKRKNAVVIYSDAMSLGLIRLKGYISYENQIIAVKSEDKTTVNINETHSPSQNRALEKMLFFLFNENEAERQVRIYLPESMRGNVEITGSYITAKN